VRAVQGREPETASFRGREPGTASFRGREPGIAPFRGLEPGAAPLEDKDVQVLARVPPRHEVLVRARTGGLPPARKITHFLVLTSLFLFNVCPASDCDTFFLRFRMNSASPSQRHFSSRIRPDLRPFQTLDSNRTDRALNPEGFQVRKDFRALDQDSYAARLLTNVILSRH